MSDRKVLLRMVSVVLPSDEGRRLRERYIDTFIDADSDHYRKYISRSQEFSDGLCYTGYLWDCIRSWEAIKFSAAIGFLLARSQPVFAFWDVHSADRIRIKDYWLFGKKDVLKLTASALLEYLDLLPQDLYIFDASMEWSIVLTHEEEGDEDWPESRIVFKAIPSKSQEGPNDHRT